MTYADAAKMGGAQWGAHPADTRTPPGRGSERRPEPPQTQGSESYLRAGAPIDRLDASKLYRQPPPSRWAAPETWAG